ncbi:MAG: GNAT family N-acetyltransferase [Anaerolineales bacterium]|jgi:GNAT superfamily N-acetyltransferase
MAELRIQKVESQSDLERFIHFPWTVYKGDPYWVPPIISERKEFLSKEHNPFFEHASADYFLALRGDQLVGTIAAISNEKYNTFQETNVGFFGFFEVLEDPEAAGALLEKAERWAKAAGHDAIIGPAQFSSNDELGLLIDGFEDRPRILMTYNPPRYRTYLESSGYHKAMDLWAYSLPVADFVANTPPKLVRVVEKIRQRRNLTVRTLDMKRYDEEVHAFKALYNTSWEKNWGFVPFTDAEMDVMARQMKQIIDPDLVILVEAEGKIVGGSISLPDLNQPLQKAYPRPGTPEFITMLKLLWNWKVSGRLDWIRVFALGVLPEYRGTGVDALMYMETAKNAIPKGFKFAEMSWILETNVMMNRAISMLGGEVYKTYRMYEKDL